VTIHRLMRCSMPYAILAATTLNRTAHLDEGKQGRRARLHWSSTLPGNTIAWTLEMEQGANGVLAHLTAEPAHGLLTRLRHRWGCVAVQPLSALKLNELVVLASQSEVTPEHVPRRRSRRGG
jgi:hypothetical protein